MKAVINILRNASGLTDLLTLPKTSGAVKADAIYIGHAIQDQEPAYITIESNIIDHYGKKDAGASLIKENYSVNIYDTGYASAKAIAKQVEAALDYASAGQYNGQVLSGSRLVNESSLNSVEENNEYWLIQQDYEIILSADTFDQTGTNVAAILLTQAQYDGLGSYENNTYYLIDNT